jgi:Xaa-Pro aminopeptidase
MKNITLTLLICCVVTICFGQSPMPVILSPKEQARVKDELLEERFKTILPTLMRQAGIDMWILIAREYNEDPVMKTMLPATWLSARRRTILVIYDRGEQKGIEALAVARYNVGNLFQKAWNPEEEPDQWKSLVQIIEARKPKKIGINKSLHYATADGLSATEHELFMQYLPKTFREKIASAQDLCVGWLETRTEKEIVIYKHIMRIAHQIIAEGLSEQVIHPGITTTEDLIWWYRQRIAELGLVTWFHPIVDIQRADLNNTESQRSFAARPNVDVIQPGDLLHVDVGITYLGLNTDTQQNAYILKSDETDAPDYLKSAYQQGLKVMDMLTRQFENGKTGNQMLAGALQQAKAANIKATIYSHPIGYHGHGSGPTIGLWDQQDGVPFTGDYPVSPNTAYSIELNHAIFLAAWNKEIRIMLEEDGYWDGKQFRYLDGRQTELFLIPRKAEKVSRF